jgi:hypothetical protein
VRLLVDENFNGAILRGLIRRLPNLDIVRVQDVGLMHTDDPVILERAANEGRIFFIDCESLTITLKVRLRSLSNFAEFLHRLRRVLSFNFCKCWIISRSHSYTNFLSAVIHDLGGRLQRNRGKHNRVGAGRQQLCREPPTIAELDLIS